MNKRLLRSVLALLVVIVLGTGATYALFTSNTATISNNSVTTGSADIKLCDEADDLWKNTIAPNLSLDDLLPGVEQELTLNKNLHLGNDDGDLLNNIASQCNTYSDLAGSSDVALNMVPKTTNLSCDGHPQNLDDELQLRFTFDGVNDTGYGSLAFWKTNTGVYGPTFAAGDSHEVQMYVKLDSASDNQGDNCVFDVTFTGQQPV